MANVIAVIWDFDKTLVNGYMQDPIFKKYNVDAKDFWNTNNKLEEFYKVKGVKVNPDTIYLNHFINKTKDGTFKGLNNSILRELGSELQFYEGVEEIFTETKKVVDNEIYSEYNIKIEHYIVSTGFAEMIKGSKIATLVEWIWGCELIEEEIINDEITETILSQVGYTIDNTTKTRALFEINKGIHINTDINVNSKVPEEFRRVQFENMIYIADGPSDIPAFSVVNKLGGATFAIYPAKDKKAFKQVEQMRKDGRVNMYAEADYSKDTTAHMWIVNKVEEFAERIRKTEQAKLHSLVSDTPKHII